jgi:hypothetical protein
MKAVGDEKQQALMAKMQNESEKLRQQLEE